MKNRWLALASLCILGVLSRATYSQTMQRESFETKIYSIEAVSHFGVSDDKFAALTDAQKENLVDARNNLMNMLQAIEHRGDVTMYATPETVAKYKGSAPLAASIIDSETSILAAGVSDFTLVGTETIKLKFFALVSSEGSIVVSEKTAVLKKTSSGWRFATLE